MLDLEQLHEAIGQAGIEINLQGNGHGDQQHMEKAAGNVVGLKGEDQHQRGQQRRHRDRREFRQQRPFKPGLSALADQPGAQGCAREQRHHDEDHNRGQQNAERYGEGRCPAGLFVTLLVNWIVKPFSMALLAWIFFRIVFAAFITPAEADQYIAGCIILAAAPCTAMVFVWSHLTRGDPAYTLVQVSVNDLIMLLLFVPIVQFLVRGASTLTVPFGVLLTSVVVFIVVPLVAGASLRAWLVRKRGQAWFEGTLLPKFAPVTDRKSVVYGKS